MATSLAFDIIAKDRASSTFDKVGNSADGAGGKFRKMGAAAKMGAAGIAVVAVAAGKFAIDAIGKASDLNETVSKSNVIFGSQAKAMEKWAAGGARTMGMSKAAALGAASGFGDMFSQIGFGQQQTAKMSKSVVQLAADFGSFNNLETADVAERMSAAFRGEYDSLQAVIPNINAARVETEALAKTGKKAAGELTAQEKAAAVLAIMHKDGARAAGDFERTSGSLANQQKILKAQFENVQASIGQKLLPVAVKLAQWMNDKLIPATQKLWGWISDKLGPSAVEGGSQWLKFAKGMLDFYKAVWEKVYPVVVKLAKWVKNDLIPPLRELADKVMVGVKKAMDNAKGSMDDLEPAFKLIKGAAKLLGDYITKILIPTWTKVAQYVLPAVGSAFKGVAKIIGKVSDAAIWLWNNAFQPTFRFILNGAAGVIEGLGSLVSKLAKVPGAPKWVKDLAKNVDNTADRVRNLADNIRDIPERKTVKVTVDVYQRITNPKHGAYIPPTVLPTRATGDPSWRGGMVRVGEQGAEDVILPRGSRIKPADRSRGRDDGDMERAMERAMTRALSRLPILRLPDDGRAAYLLTGGI